MALTFRQLKVLEAVVSTGSITLAAERVLISQPAVSKSIAALEEQVGFEIFKRLGNRISLTEKGDALYRETSRLLGIVDDFDSVVTDIRERGAQRMRIATTHMLSQSNFLAEALGHFCQMHPRAQLQIEAMSRQDLVRVAMTQRADIVMGYLPFTSPDVAASTIGASRICAIAKAGQYFADKKTLVAQDLKDQPLITLFERSRLRRVFDQYLYQAGIRPTIRAEVANASVTLQLAQQNMGLGISDEIAISGLNLATQGMEIFPFEDGPELELGFIDRLDRDHSDYTEQLKDLISNAWRQSQPDTLS